MNDQTRKGMLAGMVLLLAASGWLVSQQALQTQSHDTADGVEVDLLSSDVQNNIVTLKLKFRNTGTAEANIIVRYKDCYIMDETNQKKYYALKDSDGLYIAGPMYDQADGGRFWYDIAGGKSKGMWIKFPEPADHPSAITVAIPGVQPFENVKAGR